MLLVAGRVGTPETARDGTLPTAKSVTALKTSEFEAVTKGLVDVAVFRLGDPPATDPRRWVTTRRHKPAYRYVTGVLTDAERRSRPPLFGSSPPPHRPYPR